MLWNFLKTRLSCQSKCGVVFHDHAWYETTTYAPNNFLDLTLCTAKGSKLEIKCVLSCLFDGLRIRGSMRLFGLIWAQFNPCNRGYYGAIARWFISSKAHTCYGRTPAMAVAYIIFNFMSLSHKCHPKRAAVWSQEFANIIVRIFYYLIFKMLA